MACCRSPRFLLAWYRRTSHHDASWSFISATETKLLHRFRGQVSSCTRPTPTSLAFPLASRHAPGTSVHGLALDVLDTLSSVLGLGRAHTCGDHVVFLFQEATFGAAKVVDALLHERSGRLPPGFLGSPSLSNPRSNPNDPGFDRMRNRRRPG